MHSLCSTQTFCNDVYIHCVTATAEFGNFMFMNISQHSDYQTIYLEDSFGNVQVSGET